MASDKRFDESVSRWLEEAAPSRLPERVLGATFERTRRSRQQVGWRGLPGRMHVPRFAPALGAAAVVIIAATLALTFYAFPSGIGGPATPAPLPTTADAWSRVVIKTPGVTGRVASLAVSPHGLLAAVGGDEPARLAFSSDGRNWTLVPGGQHPRLSNDGSFGMPSLVGTDRGFLMLQLNEIWGSDNGYDWRRLAGETTDPDLSTGGPDVATAGGPGIVGVGDDKAWYSMDGSDWSVADVPALPDEILALPDSDRYVGMTGVTAGGDGLVAWGIAEVPRPDNGDENLTVPLLWASHDGRTWASVVDPEMDSVTAVTGGPQGFVATGQAGSEAAVWLSADGEAWERVGDDDFTSSVRLELNAASATSAGYVVVGTEGRCVYYPCPEQRIVIWTSADGRSWSSIPSDDLLAGSQAYRAVALGSSFVIGGAFDGQPAIWISDPEPGSGAGAAGTTGTGGSPAPAPTEDPGEPAPSGVSASAWMHAEVAP